MTGVGGPPMCSDWCHICNVSTLDIHSVGTQLKLLLAPQECQWDQLCVQVCKCEQQLEVVGLPVPCASATWTECAFLTWFGNQTLSRVLLPLHIVSAGLSLRAGQALSCYWQFDLQLATITVPSCLTVTAERRNAKQYKTHIKASEITNDHKNKTLYIAATKRNWDIGHFQWEGKVPNSSEVTIPWVLLRPCSAPRPLYSNTNCCKVHYIFCGQKSYYWEYKLMHCIMYCLNIFNRVVCSIAFGTIYMLCLQGMDNMYCGPTEADVDTG